MTKLPLFAEEVFGGHQPKTEEAADQTATEKMQTSEQVIEKLRKLLRLATDKGATQAEAELAMQRAQELALRHKIELAGIDHAERPAEEYTKDTQQRRRTFQAKYVESIVRKHFSVSMVLGRAGELFMIGKPTDIAFAKWVMEFLEAEFPRLWTAYQKQTGCGQGARVNYFLGLHQGLDAKLTENKRRVEEEALRGKGDLAGKYQIVLVEEKKALAMAMLRFFPNVGPAAKSNVRIRHQSAIDAGRTAGRNININRPLNGGGPVNRLR